MNQEEIVEEHATFGMRKDGVYYCVLAFGAGAIEGYGNSRWEAAAYVAEQLEYAMQEEPPINEDGPRDPNGGFYHASDCRQPIVY